MTMAGVCSGMGKGSSIDACVTASSHCAATAPVLRIEPGHLSNPEDRLPTFSTRNSFSTAAWLECTMPKLNLKRRKLALQQGAPGVVEG